MSDLKFSQTHLVRFLKEHLFIIALGLIETKSIYQISILAIHYFMSYYIQHSYNILTKFRWNFKSTSMFAIDFSSVVFVIFTTGKWYSFFTCLIWAGLVIGEYYYNRTNKYILIRVITPYIQMFILYMLCDIYSLNGMGIYTIWCFNQPQFQFPFKKYIVVQTFIYYIIGIFRVGYPIALPLAVYLFNLFQQNIVLSLVHGFLLMIIILYLN